MKRLLKRVQAISVVLMILAAVTVLILANLNGGETSAKICYGAFLVECVSILVFFLAHNKRIDLEEKENGKH